LEQRRRSAALPAIVLLGRVARDISLGHITGKRGAIAAARIAAAAAARALQRPEDGVSYSCAVASLMTKRAPRPALPPAMPRGGKRLLS
jgi:flavin-dependent dehydrogenase